MIISILLIGDALMRYIPLLDFVIRI